MRTEPLIRRRHCRSGPVRRKQLPHAIPREARCIVSPCKGLAIMCLRHGELLLFCCFVGLLQSPMQAVSHRHPLDSCFLSFLCSLLFLLLYSAVYFFAQSLLQSYLCHHSLWTSDFSLFWQPGVCQSSFLPPSHHTESPIKQVLKLCFWPSPSLFGR
jgi:hypothetical protein